jgi:hypothetical protein
MTAVGEVGAKVAASRALTEQLTTVLQRSQRSRDHAVRLAEDSTHLLGSCLATLFAARQAQADRRSWFMLVGRVDGSRRRVLAARAT